RVAILDMLMPGKDGETLGRKIKADALLKQTILVMLTSAGRRGDAARLDKIGFAAYLTKPVKQSRLYDCLVTVLSRAPRAAAGQRPIITRHSIAEDKKQSIRILLAEDNITNQKVALRILEKLGFRANAVANGQEAVKALETIPYDLVLMDVQMPEMDGFEATRVIRDKTSSVKDHTIPIIAMTAHALKGDREKCLEAGMDDYVPKPFQPQELLEAIQRVLPEGGSSKASQTTPTVLLEEGVFDRSALLDRLFGDEELVREILETFLEDAPLQIGALKEALNKDDASLVRECGHKLKGSSGMVCAVGMQKVGLQIEEAGEKGDLGQAASLKEKIEQEFAKFKKLLFELEILM
ncbi:MAG: response regulator, partial [Candidatus Adiutricales bacterium]